MPLDYTFDFEGNPACQMSLTNDREIEGISTIHLDRGWVMDLIVHVNDLIGSTRVLLFLLRLLLLH